MVDNNNDEYQFADLDVINNELTEDVDNTVSAKDSSPFGEQNEGKPNILRNALIAVVLVIAAMLIYKFMGSFFTKKTPVTASAPDIMPIVKQPPVVVEQPPVAAPVQAPSQPSPDYAELNQKISSLDLNQQTLRSDMNGMNNQLGGINSNINNLNAKIADLSQLVATLSSKVEEQSNQIAHLLVVRTAPPKISHVVKRVTVPQLSYYIQAAIPGRAWLIASNGSTLTVREGTNIVGYGRVKLIDPNQGRVLTSSGRVIRFSQQDS